MAEIYWLTRLEGVKILAIVLLALSIFAVISAAIWYSFTDDDYMKKERLVLMRLIKKLKTTWLCSLLLGILGSIFIPSKNELLLIYGLGTTVDYVKSNEKAKQLPDKAIEALTRYIDEISKEKK